VWPLRNNYQARSYNVFFSASKQKTYLKKHLIWWA
jgi:hypothetical protein